MYTEDMMWSISALASSSWKTPSYELQDLTLSNVSSAQFRYLAAEPVFGNSLSEEVLQENADIMNAIALDGDVTSCTMYVLPPRHFQL